MAAIDNQNRLNSERTQDSELEQYGVWVKAGPEDVDETEAEDEAFTLTDLGDDELDEAEMEILGVDQELSKEPNEFDESIELDLGEPLDLGESLDLDETQEHLDTVDEPAASTEPSGESTDFDDGLLTLEDDELALPLEDEADELGLDDLDLSEAEPLPAEPVDATEDEDELLELSTDEDVVGGIDIDDELPGSADDLTLDLSSLDVDAFEEPMTGEDAQPLEDDEEAAPDLDEPLDLELEPGNEAALAATDDIEPAPEIANAEAELENGDLDLDSLDLGDDTEMAELDLSTLPGDEDEFAALGDAELSQAAEDDLPELEVDDELDLETSLELDDDFDDLGAVEDELFGEPDAPSEPHPVATSSDSADMRSLSLLESIERELSSIRSELSSLKDELSTLRTAPSVPRRSRQEQPVEDEDAGGGFFEDEGDDDETIALTGAELDNIMNTAEFTEETGEPTEFDEFIQPAPPDDESNPLQEITLDEAPEDLGPIDLDLEAVEPQSNEADADLFGASEDAVEALAGLDIDAELADIEELDDQEVSEEHFDVASEEEPIEDLEIDVEPEAGTDEEGELEVEDLELTIEEDTMEEPLSTDSPLEDLADLGSAVPPADTPIPENLKGELRSVLDYMDKLLDSLPEEKIQEFAASDHFKVYKRLFEELGLEQ